MFKNALSFDLNIVQVSVEAVAPDLGGVRASRGEEFF